MNADASFAAEAATRNLTANAGSREWEAARQVVIKYMKARRDLMACYLPVQDLQNMPFSDRDRLIWRDTLRRWLSSYEAQSRFQLSIVEALIDHDLSKAELERPYASFP